MNTIKNISGVTIAGTAVISPSAQIGIGSVIHDWVVIGDNVFIGKGVTIFSGAVIGRAPKVAGSMATNVGHSCNSTYIGDHSVVGAGATIYCGVHLEQDVLIGDGARIRENCYIGYKSIVGSNCTFQNDVRMGVRSRVVDLSHITAKVQIGNGVFISTGVLTMNDNSFNHDGELKAPKFEDGCMVGGNATILPGVVIGKDARVAAGAIVTKSVAPGVTVWGVPAKPGHRDREPKKIDSYDGNYPDSSPSYAFAKDAMKDWRDELVREAGLDETR